MATFEFPDNPHQDQIVVGPNGQQFQWDGEKWIAIGSGGGGGGGGIPDAPSNGQAYGRKDATWIDLATIFALIGTGGGGIPEPSTAGSFLRTNTSSWVAGLPLTGGTLTGPGFLTINSLTATTSDHVFTVNTPGKQYQFMIAGDGRTWLGGYSPYGIFFDATTARFGKPAVFESTVTLNADAASAMQAVPLQQVQSLIAAAGGGGDFLPINNPTFTGMMTGPSYAVNAGNLNIYSAGTTSGIQFYTGSDVFFIRGDATLQRALYLGYGDRYFMINRLGLLTVPQGGNVLLAQDATANLHAVPLQQVQSLIAAIGPGPQIVAVADEATAISQSQANPNNFYVWS